MMRVDKQLPSTDVEKANKFNDLIKPVIEGIENVIIKLVASVGAGDKYQPIKDIDPLEDGQEKITLEHKDGQVWLIDFWATWCPPCQRPMAHNQEMLEKRGQEWGSDVRIIGISIDQDKNKLKSHVNDKKWTSVEHYHRAGSKCSEQYSVNGVPHVMLVDKTGTIVFKGHPASRDLEKDLDTLRAGEKLTGEGTFSAGADGGAEDESSDYKNLDSKEIMDHMDNF